MVLGEHGQDGPYTGAYKMHLLGHGFAHVLGGCFLHQSVEMIPQRQIWMIPCFTSEMLGFCTRYTRNIFYLDESI